MYWLVEGAPVAVDTVSDRAQQNNVETKFGSLTSRQQR